MQMPSVSAMTLRQKIGQTGMPAPNVVAAGVKRCSGYKAYFEEFPFTGRSPVKLRPEFRDL